MPHIVCVKCERRFRPKTNGVNVVETFGENDDRPYKLWRADLLECPGCGAQIVAGFAESNYAEHYEPNFAEALAKAEPKFYDKSCY